MKMRKVLSLILALTMVFALAACGNGSSGGDDAAADGADSNASSGGKVTLKLGTGGTSGTYYAFGGVVATTLSGKLSNIGLTVTSTGASKDNIMQIADKTADVAIVQNDVMHYAMNGTDLFESDGAIEGFSSMAAAYAEVIQIVAKPEITSIEDLAGKNVSVGDQGSGTEFNARQILDAYGISFNDINKQNLSFADSADAYKDGKIDAFFVVAGAPTSAITELNAANEINILSVDDDTAAKLAEEYGFYTQYSIPGGTYSGIDTDVKTVAVKATFIVADDLSEDVVYELTKALFENKDEIATTHEKGKELDLDYAIEGISVPFHPGAAKYFTEQGKTVESK